MGVGSGMESLVPGLKPVRLGLGSQTSIPVELQCHMLLMLREVASVLLHLLCVKP